MFYRPNRGVGHAVLVAPVGERREHGTECLGEQVVQTAEMFVEGGASDIGCSRNVSWRELHVCPLQDETEAKSVRLKEKIATLKKQVQWLKEMEVEVLDVPDQQVSLTDPDARSMATGGRGSGIVGYNVQAAVDTEHHLIVAHQVTRVGHDRAQLAPMASKAKTAMGVEQLDVLADRGYFSGEQILACEKDKVTPSSPNR